MTDTGANKGSGYKACGCGMGPALNIGASSGAYVLADCCTWRNFKNRAAPTVLEEGDKRLFNPYGVMLLSAAKHSQVKTAEVQKFVDWVTGSAGQAVITSYKIGGEQFFSERGEVGWFGSTGKFRPTTVDRYHYVNYCCAAIAAGRINS
jgi:tungstate transport system substrate-binding protein